MTEIGREECYEAAESDRRSDRGRASDLGKRKTAKTVESERRHV